MIQSKQGLKLDDDMRDALCRAATDKAAREYPMFQVTAKAMAGDDPNVQRYLTVLLEAFGVGFVAGAEANICISETPNK